MAARKKASIKASAKKDARSIEPSRRDTADKLRGSVESSEYKHVVLSLIFLKFASDKFERRRAELIEEGREKYVDRVEFYAMKNVSRDHSLSRPLSGELTVPAAERLAADAL